MSDRWLDVSANQRPELMRYDLWAPTFRRGQYRLQLGRNPDATGPVHRARMRAAGMLTGPYAVPWEGNDQVSDCHRWVDNIPPDDENHDWVDAERAALTERELDAYCTTYDRLGRDRLAIYTGYPWWMSHVPPDRRARYARYPLIIAAYPFDTPAGIAPPMDPVSVALRSTPPHNRRPPIPEPWTLEAGWQHTGQGSLPGYVGRLDMGIYMVNPSEPPALTAAGHVRAALALLGA